MTSHAQQRRVFRGRGGPTDGRLPKHNAARRRRTPSENERKSCDASSDPVPVEDNSISGVQAEEARVEEEKLPFESTEEEEDQFLKEVKHLNQRIKNVKYSIETSTISFNDVKVFENNVLRALANCALEWKSILKYHGVQSLSDADETAPVHSNTCKVCGQNLFELVHQGMQCGPLAGSKVGYFRRCGSETAKIVHDFLNELAPEHGSATAMFWSDKQAEAVARWKREALKASEKGTPPSKHVQKKMEKASKRKKK